MDSIDKLLDQIKAEYQESDRPQPQQKQPLLKKTTSLDSLLSEVKTEAKQINKPLPLPKKEPSLDNLLGELQADYQAQDRAQEQLRQEKLKAEELKQQLLQKQQREALKSQAIAWLKQLDSLSSEGLWFEKFAEKYSSKLEAAIVYLQDLQENHH